MDVAPGSLFQRRSGTQCQFTYLYPDISQNGGSGSLRRHSDGRLEDFAPCRSPDLPRAPIYDRIRAWRHSASAPTRNRPWRTGWRRSASVERGHRREVHPLGRPRRPERQQGRDLRLPQAPAHRHGGQVPAGAVPIPQPVPGPPHPHRQDRGGHPGPEERGRKADRQDPPPEEKAFQTGQGEDAGRQAPCFGEEERPVLPARPARRVSPARLSSRCTPAGG